jgi:hypothetical protein
MLAFLGSVDAYGQEPIPVTKNYVAWAHEFLRTMYPEMNGKKCSLTLETAGSYDSPGTPLQPQILYVGKLPQYDILGYVAGYVKSPPSEKPSPAPKAGSAEVRAVCVPPRHFT